ncbi:isocitrate lyase/PEP mutase family protein [Terasakiella sp. A23]|uniref:isocitrate lyase/PEP mutase family protein n=1 Tax=Terasakiella sp. FCG-A23 TaxID=3080561 RepID=UPI002952D2C6|nr:isocitrate lyase/PEP mutase family protein [Terasakiella sp. A23]MDV7341715.1 isocitrate lyase/PEP mutase family protein [Terasakiella sp. A23]
MSAATKLRDLLASNQFLMMPCCFDGMSARLVERAGYPLTFMSGFSVSAARNAMPDTGLLSYGEMVDQGRSICQATNLPVIGDGDTGYGNALNVKRTVAGYAQACFAGIMIEDQLSPKRCGHTKGKSVVGFDEACMRIQAAVDARNEGADILIMARTDARESLGMGDAIKRMKAFEEIGADILFLEAPQSADEMKQFCTEIKGPKMANMVEQGKTPVLPPAELQAMGYKIAAYPLTLMLSALKAMETALEELKGGAQPSGLASFQHLQDVIGFSEYYEAEERYKT